MEVKSLVFLVFVRFVRTRNANRCCAQTICCRQRNAPACNEMELVGAVGIEPTTFGLKGRCSTTELRP